MVWGGAVQMTKLGFCKQYLTWSDMGLGFRWSACGGGAIADQFMVPSGRPVT
jgi:hypothetical protein